MGFRELVGFPLVLLYVNVLLYFIAVGMNESIIARYTAYLGGSPFQVGLIWSTLFLVSILLRTISGYVSDSGYRFLMMVLGPIVAGLGAYVIGSSSTLLLLAVGRALQGVASAIYIPASISSASILSTPKTLGRVLGIRSGIISIGFMVGPLISGYLVDSFGYYTSFTIISLVFALTILPAIPLRRYVEVGSKSLSFKSFINNARIVLSYKTLIVAIMVTVMYSAVYATIASFLQPIYLEAGLPATSFSLYMTLFNAVGIPAKLLGGALSDKYGPLMPMLFGLTSMTFSVVLLIYYTYSPLSYASAVLLGLGFSPLIPATQYLALSNIPAKNRGIATGFYAMGFDLGNLIGPLTLGKVAELIGGYVNVFPILLVFTLTALAISITVCRPRRHQH